MAECTPFIEVKLIEQPVRYAPFDPFPEASGGECVFLGRTRVEAHPKRGRLVRLSYEAYESLAMQSMQELAEHAVSKRHCHAVRLHHAIGEVPPGEASVLVQVAAGHRAVAFEACRYIIDALKQRIPIWKREVWEDGTTWAPGTPVKSTQTTHPGEMSGARPRTEP